MLDGFILFVIGLASLLSGVVRLLILTQHKLIVLSGNARAMDICVLSGISPQYKVQDYFGPATLDGMWPSVTLPDIHRNTRPIGYLVGRQWPNYGSVLVGLIAPFVGLKIVSFAVLGFFALQVLGWGFTFRLSTD